MKCTSLMSFEFVKDITNSPLTQNPPSKYRTSPSHLGDCKNSAFSGAALTDWSVMRPRLDILKPNPAGNDKQPWLETTALGISIFCSMWNKLIYIWKTGKIKKYISLWHEEYLSVAQRFSVQEFVKKQQIKAEVTQRVMAQKMICWLWVCVPFPLFFFSSGSSLKKSAWHCGRHCIQKE